MREKDFDIKNPIKKPKEYLQKDMSALTTFLKICTWMKT